jgi:hypothetical protein
MRKPRKFKYNDPAIINPESKICYSCHESKPLIEFCKCKTGIYGYHNHCKACAKIAKQRWTKENPNWSKNYISQPEYKEKMRIQQNKRYHTDPEYRAKILELNKLRRRQEPAKKMQRLNERFKYKTNINYKLAKSLRARLGLEIRKMKQTLDIELHKTTSAIELLGCSIFDLKIHLESQFKEGMSWENHGHGENCWHIDHILPCASFDLTDIEQQKKCFHYSNLQPLWQTENLSKSDKLI